MTRTNLIFTHGAVFSVGIAAAMIANSFRDPQNGGAQSGGNPRVTLESARSSADSLKATEFPRVPERLTASSGPLSKKDGKSATDRLARHRPDHRPFERQRALDGSGGFARPGGVRRQSPSNSASSTISTNRRRRIRPHPPRLGQGGSARGAGIRRTTPSQPGRTLDDSHHLGRQRRRRRRALGTRSPSMETVRIPTSPPSSKASPGNDIANASRLAQTMPFGAVNAATRSDSITRALFLQGTDAAMAFPASIADRKTPRRIRRGHRQPADRKGRQPSGLVGCLDAAGRNPEPRRPRRWRTRWPGWIRKQRPHGCARSNRKPRRQRREASFRSCRPPTSPAPPNGSADWPARRTTTAWWRNSSGAATPRPRAVRRLDSGSFRSESTTQTLSPHAGRVGPQGRSRRETMGRLERRARRRGQAIRPLTCEISDFRPLPVSRDSFRNPACRFSKKPANWR